MFVDSGLSYVGPWLLGKCVMQTELSARVGAMVRSDGAEKNGLRQRLLAYAGSLLFGECVMQPELFARVGAMVRSDGAGMYGCDVFK